MKQKVMCGDYLRQNGEIFFLADIVVHNKELYAVLYRCTQEPKEKFDIAGGYSFEKLPILKKYPFSDYECLTENCRDCIYFKHEPVGYDAPAWKPFDSLYENTEPRARRAICELRSEWCCEPVIELLPSCPYKRVTRSAADKAFTADKKADEAVMQIVKKHRIEALYTEMFWPSYYAFRHIGSNGQTMFVGTGKKRNMAFEGLSDYASSGFPDDGWMRYVVGRDSLLDYCEIAVSNDYADIIVFPDAETVIFVGVNRGYEICAPQSVIEAVRNEEEKNIGRAMFRFAPNSVTWEWNRIMHGPEWDLKLYTLE